MKKTEFIIRKMDCPSEEGLIRIKLEGLSFISSLEFDIPGRKLYVYHNGDEKRIASALSELKLGSEITDSIEIDHYTENIEQEKKEKRILILVLLINFFLFIGEMVAGLLAHSMGLVADALDMLADSIVYGLSLMAVGSILAFKKKIARISGYLQFLLATLGFLEVFRRFLGYGENPEFRTMIIVSLFALAGNTASLILLNKTRSSEAHMKASMIFTSNDIIANTGVIIAGIMVYFLSSRIPDLVVGTLVFSLVARGAWRILQLSKP